VPYRRHALALRALLCEVAAPTTAALTEVLQSLATVCALSTTVGAESQAEASRNTVTTLTDLCGEVGHWQYLL
jgi:hypothetical protein